MKPQIKNAFFGILILLLAACGPVQPVSTVEAVVTQVSADAVTLPDDGVVPDAVAKYIGLNYPPLPEILTNDVSMLIQDVEDYGLFFIADGENKMLWLSKMTHRDADGNAYWEVKDVLDLTNVEAGKDLLLDGCSINGVPDHKVFVIGKDGTISMAWRANTTLNVFETVPIAGIECQTDKVVSF